MKRLGGRISDPALATSVVQPGLEANNIEAVINFEAQTVYHLFTTFSQ
jgi:hypothetical protein